MTAVLLGSDLTSGEPICVTPADRGLGTYMIGVTGTGKSTLLLNMMAQDIAAGHGLTLLDPHGDLAPEVLRRVPAARANDVIYLDFGDTRMVPGFDIFSARYSTDAADQASQQAGVVEAFRKLLGTASWGPRIERLLNHIAVTFRENPGCTLTEMPLLLTSEAFRHFCMEKLAPMSSTYEFWESYDRKSPVAQEAYRESTMTKIDAFVANPILKHIMGQPGKVIDFAGVLRDKKILIVRMPRGVLRGATRFIGYLFADRLLNAAFARESIPETRRTFHAIYCDEFQYFATPDFEEFIAGGRKYGIGLLLAHQWRDQVDREMQAATVAARSRVVFQVNTEDAPSFARGFASPTLPAMEEEETIPSNPWDVLTSRGHADYWIVARTKAIQEQRTEIERRLRNIWYRGNLLTAVIKTAVLDPLDQYLNRYLYQRLVGTPAGDTQYSLEKILVTAQWQIATDTIFFLAADLLDLGDRLAEARMTYKRRDPSRKVTDISQGLASLPSFHAKCKLMQGASVVERTLRTNPPPDPQPESIARGIIAKCRRDYCTVAAEVDRTLAAYHRQLERFTEEEEEDEPPALYDRPPTRF